MSKYTEISGFEELSDIVTESMKEVFKEDPARVVDRIRKAPYDAYMCVTYSKTSLGFVLQGRVHIIEKLIAPIYYPKNRVNKYVDGIVLNALSGHARYDQEKGNVRRVPEKFYFTDGNFLEFGKFVKVSRYRPSCLLFTKLDPEERDRLLDRDGAAWENHFITAERELQQRCRQWKKSRRKQEKKAS